jgi:hypothetical protein
VSERRVLRGHLDLKRGGFINLGNEGAMIFTLSQILLKLYFIISF